MAVIFSKNEKNNFDIFCKFYPNLVPDIQRSLDWPSTLKNNQFAISFLLNDTIQQIRNVEFEFQEVDKQGFSTGAQREILTIKFQLYINSLYTYLENLSYIGHIIHKRRFKRHFSEQFKIGRKILQDSQDYEYFQVIIQNQELYEKIHAIRSESTHYLNGFIYLSKEKTIGLMYRYFIHDGEFPKIEIDDLEEFLLQSYSYIDLLTNSYGDYMIRFLDDDFVSADLCGSPQPFQMYGQREYTYKEYREDLPGRCYHAFNCPHTSHCQAYAAKNNLMRTNLTKNEV